MHDALDIFLLEPPGTPAKTAALQALLNEHPDLADAVAHWREMLVAVRDDVADWPARHLLVLYALDRSGHSTALNDVDRALLEPAQASLDAALEAHPALQAIVSHIESQADAFEVAWQLYLPEEASSFGVLPAQSPATAPQQRPPNRIPDRVAERHTDRPARPAHAHPLRRWGWRVGAAAAVLAFVAVLGTLFLREQAEVVLVTGSTEVRELTLADGSTVRLLPNSQLVYAEGKAFNRSIRLEGKAYFNVMSSDIPFTVTTETALTTVLGTTFAIASTEVLTEVTLVSGRVTVAPRGASSQMVILGPGQASRVARNALPTTPMPVDLAMSLQWTGQFVFRATPLARMAEQLTAHYQVPVLLDPSLPADSINGTFEHTEALSEILNQVATSIGIDVQPMAAGGYRLVPGR